MRRMFSCAHFHNTRNTGLAKSLAAAVRNEVDVIDASCGGIGGCPFAPNATGIVATEVVYMLERAGFGTGIDLSAMIETARWLEKTLGHDVPSGLLRAGSFPKPAAQ